MQHIKSYLFQRFTTVSTTFLISFCCIALLGIRLKISHSFFLLFLVWNLFLAAIPFFISFYARSKKSHHRIGLLLMSCPWLLFLPNAPYIITDFIHLTHLKANFLVLDTLLIASFAIGGLYFYLQSVRDMEVVWSAHISEKTLRFSIAIIHFLCGFGIYLGRFLRFNSWDLIQDPVSLASSILKSSASPVAIVTTIFFGTGLWICYYVYKKRGC